MDGITDIKVQLKGRISLAKKYINKNIYIAFIDNNGFYLYPHDEVLKKIKKEAGDKVWQEKGTWSAPKLSNKNKDLLKKFKLIAFYFIKKHLKLFYLSLL